MSHQCAVPHNINVQLLTCHLLFLHRFLEVCCLSPMFLLTINTTRNTARKIINFPTTIACAITATAVNSRRKEREKEKREENYIVDRLGSPYVDLIAHAHHTISTIAGSTES